MTGPRIAVVVKGYPRLSETFIAQEILALEARGLPLAIWSLRRPTDRACHPMHEAIRAPVAYLPEYLRDAPLRVLKGLGAALLRPRLPGLLALFARDFLRDPTASRLRRLGQALVLARELPAAVTHIHVHFLHTPASVARYAARLTGRAWSFSAHAKDIWTTPGWELSEKLADAAWGVTCTRDGFRRLEGLSTSSLCGGACPADAGQERGATVQDGARVPSPVRERDRVRVEKGPEEALHGPLRRRDLSVEFSSLTPTLSRTGRAIAYGNWLLSAPMRSHIFRSGRRRCAAKAPAERDENSPPSRVAEKNDPICDRPARTGEGARRGSLPCLETREPCLSEGGHQLSPA